MIIMTAAELAARVGLIDPDESLLGVRFYDRLDLSAAIEGGTYVSLKDWNSFCRYLSDCDASINWDNVEIEIAERFLNWRADGAEQ